jgi:hypothetical protein
VTGLSRTCTENQQEGMAGDQPPSVFELAAAELHAHPWLGVATATEHFLEARPLPVDPPIDDQQSN